ncbi:MAG TPA: D-alanine--D-alanine ligase [Bacillota bacterium]|nr:D-alanine--D-alanine ligase [Bacillota bacterium]
MHIGITYDLKEAYKQMGYSDEQAAEFDAADTIDALEQSLGLLGHSTDRIGGIVALATRLVAGDRWDMVFNIAEGYHGAARESQVPALLDAYCIPYTFSDPFVLGLCLHKGLTKRVVRDLGLPTAAFVVVRDETDLLQVDLDYPVFAKPDAEGTSKGIDDRSIAESPAELESVCRRLWKKFDQPVLVEEFLPGREFTVAILGTGRSARCLGAMEVLIVDDAADEVYSFDNKMNYQQNVRYVALEGSLRDTCCQHALRVWQGLGCRDAGRVDLRMDAAGTPNFLEVNPLAGLNPRHSDLPILARLQRMSYETLISEIVDSALKRV